MAWGKYYRPKSKQVISRPRLEVSSPEYNSQTLLKGIIFLTVSIRNRYIICKYVFICLGVNCFSHICQVEWGIQLICSLLTRLQAGRPKNRGFDCCQGQEIFFFSRAYTPAPAHIQPPIKWATTAFPTGKPNHSSPSSAEVTNEYNYTPSQAAQH